MEKYINNSNYEIQIMLSKKYEQVNIPSYAMDYTLAVNHHHNGEVYLENGQISYMSINDFKKMYFGKQKINNLTIFRQE